MGSITANCGHQLADADSGIDIRYGSYDCDAVDGYRKAVVYTVYCPTCAARAKQWPEFIETDEDERRWLRSAWSHVSPLAKGR
jgi:hypothetical protein